MAGDGTDLGFVLGGNGVGRPGEGGKFVAVTTYVGKATEAGENELGFCGFVPRRGWSTPCYAKKSCRV